MTRCPFCVLIKDERVLIDHGSVVAIPDAYPLTAGHSLVLPRRHHDDYFSLSCQERIAMLDLASELQAILAEQYAPDGFNLGLNAGAAAGQTVEHAHLHVIPRFLGDVTDPRGGVRWVIPDKAPYWTTPPQ